jgi:hypothetical protein
LHLHLVSTPSDADFGARMLDYQLSSGQVTRAQAMDSLVPLSELVAQASPWPWPSWETRDQVLVSPTPRVLRTEKNESLAPGAATPGGFAPKEKVRYVGEDGSRGGVAYVVGGSGGVEGRVQLQSRQGELWTHPVELVALDPPCANLGLGTRAGLGLGRVRGDRDRANYQLATRAVGIELTSN